jgi:2-keto-4-pentenoate hydratase/2-oxohepta-3-ene-1,7-dioic acid hydratase in catechol pathway
MDMKLVTFMDPDFIEKVGAVLRDGRIVDLMSAWVQFGGKLLQSRNQVNMVERCFGDLLTFLKHGEESVALAQKMLEHIEDSNDQDVAIYTPTQIRFLPPITRPGKFIAMGRNFSEHLQESKDIWKEKGKEINAPKLPVGFVKVATTLIGHEASIKYPKGITRLDYELELAVVIGKSAKDVSKETALDHVAGYMIFNDVSARDVQQKEMENQLLLLGKNFDTFGPMGPYLVLKNEISDPQNLAMQLRVNGEVRQNSNTRHMIYQIPDLVAYWSQMTLEPGDMIASGTPAGVASSRKPDQPSWFLKVGDVIEAEIEGLGLLRNRVEGN